MAVSKVVYGTTVLVDLTEDTVTADDLMLGTTAHDATGTLITGTIYPLHIYAKAEAPTEAFGNDGDIVLITSDTSAASVSETETEAGSTDTGSETEETDGNTGSD